MPRHLLDLFGLSQPDARALIDRSLALKRDEHLGRRPPILAGRTLGLLFEKPSLRTRVSFEVAIARLGGNAIFLNSNDVGLGVRESLVDFARIVSQYVDALTARTFSHATLEELARFASIPVINALSDESHPCQAMADIMTIEELRGPACGKKIVFVGDGNNVARSLAAASALFGAHFVLVAPPGYEFAPDFVGRYEARFPAAPFEVAHDPHKAVAGADVVYTDVWVSMGQENEAERRRAAFAPYQVNQELLSRANPGAIFLHCLPAHRGEEVTREVLDGPNSQVVVQAANRLYFEMALLIWLVGEGYG
jgi:ornithine carbamoyltransferase